MHRSGRRSHTAFTLIELLVVIAIIALLLSILVPTLSKAKELARRLPCMSNLHGMGIGYNMYIGDSNDIITPVREHYSNTDWGALYWWPDLIIKYFDVDAKVSTTPHYDSVARQPASGNYNENFASTGIRYSQRMNCPSQKNYDETHYFSNYMWWNIPYFWNCDSSPNRTMGDGPGTPITTSKMKNLANVCYVYEENGVGSGGWITCQVTTWNVPPAIHVGSINGMMLDGHVTSYTDQFVLDRIFPPAGPSPVNDYPFYVPDY